MPTSGHQATASLAGLPYRPCVGIMMLNRDGLVWAGHRMSRSPRDPEGQGRWWQMPQGGIDADEHPVDAGLRELEEETGIRGATLLAVSKHWRRYDFVAEHVSLQRGTVFRGQIQRWIAVRFSGRDEEVDIEAKAGTAPEFSEWRWVAMLELPKLVAPFKCEVYTDVVREFAHLRQSLAGKTPSE
jgi:putative (di)nucleoside polyphosphate hydrolase